MHLKYSRQRESIKRYLAGTRDHPTADTVYMHVKEEFPNISLGTVYRNLNLLTSLGEAIKISSLDGADRFDGCVTPHSHFFCTECGQILDLEINTEELLKHKTIADGFDGIIESSRTIFYGKCGKCLKK